MMADAPRVLPLDAGTYARSIKACVHCGLCLPACPTYMETGLEADSPRGRIYLMKVLADDRIQASESVVHHLDLCLDCRACETACPSGVVYHELIEETRAILAPGRQLRGDARLVRWLALRVFTRAKLLRMLLVPARVMQKAGLYRVVVSLAPGRLGAMMRMVPADGPVWPRMPAVRNPARGDRKLVVGLHTGCVGGVLGAEVNRKAVELLQHMGCEVIVPRGQRCCGAMHHHNGYAEEGSRLAERNVRAFAGVDRVVSTIGGCGAMLKEYPEPFAGKVRDICELIAELDPPPPAKEVRFTVAYHDACHLVHAQGIYAAPRKLLGMIAGLRVVPLCESDMCCGAAGTYGLDQPEMSRRLAGRKLAHVLASGARTVVTGNVGCALQIAAEARRMGVKVDVVHPVELLHRAYCG